MSIKISICDDSDEDILQLKHALLSYDPFFDITTYTSGTELLDEVQEKKFITEILFLDIYMPGVDGIKTAKEVIARNKEIIIIFLSSSGDHYSEAYDLFAFNYIRKPFVQEKLYAVLDRAIAKLEKQSGYKIRIKHKSTIQNVDCREILYVESRNRLIFFHLADKSALQCYGKLDKLILNLPDKLFLRCHQSFVVNLAHIVEMGEGYFCIGEERIDISRKYLKTVKEQYYTYLFSNMGGGQLL